MPMQAQSQEFYLDSLKTKVFKKLEHTKKAVELFNSLFSINLGIIPYSEEH